jgi:phosphoenolpyruvate carboxylase
MPEFDYELGPQTAQEPYRRKLSFMWNRLGATLSSSSNTGGLISSPVTASDASAVKAGKTIAYRDAEELLADLELVRASLQSNNERDLQH